MMMIPQSRKRRDLAFYAGVLTHVAGIVPTLRPFARPLRAVLYDDTPNELPTGMSHTARIATVGKWFKAFLRDPQRLIARKYSLQAPCISSDEWLRMSVDAPPWGKE